MNWYKYILSRLYNWRLKHNDRMPVFGVALIMIVLHFAQLIIVYELLLTCFLNSKRIELNSTIIYIIVGIAVLIFITFFNEKRLQKYKSVFLDEPTSDKKGNVFVFHFFIIGTIVIALITPIMLWWLS